MKEAHPTRALFGVALLSLMGCLDFDAAYERCVDADACGPAGVEGGDGGGGLDSGTLVSDAGADDGGVDSGTDGGVDAGADGGVLDSGTDAGADAGGLDSGTDGGGNGPDAGGLDGGFPCLPSHCTPGTWCLERHTPGAQINYAVWASSACDVWVGGVGGTVSRFDGGSWSSSTLFAGKSIFAVQGRAPNDVWLVGQTGLIRQWNGFTFVDRSVSTGNLFSVAARFSPTRVVGPKDVYLREEQGGFVNDFPNAVWGSSINDVWVAAAAGALFRWSGGPDWSYVDAGVPVDFQGIYGVTDGGQYDVWVVGSDDLVLHYRR